MNGDDNLEKHFCNLGMADLESSSSKKASVKTNKEKTKCRGMEITPVPDSIYNEYYISTCEKDTHKSHYFCLDHFKNHHILQKKKYIREDYCAICCDNLKKQYISTPCCETTFCKDCIEQWHFSNPEQKGYGPQISSKCPMCRKKIFSMARRHYEKNNILFIVTK